MSPFSLLFEQFIKEKRFLTNLSEKTIRSHKLAFQWFEKLNTELTKQSLNNFVIGLRESGMNPGGCNVKIRSINSFLTWCFENGHNPENLRIKKLKGEQVVIKTFSDAHIRAFLSFKPKEAYQWRIHTTICLLIDSGARIAEILSMTTGSVDMEQMMINITKGVNQGLFLS
jgi:site-specific recombinase XerD